MGEKLTSCWSGKSSVRNDLSTQLPINMKTTLFLASTVPRTWPPRLWPMTGEGSHGPAEGNGWVIRSTPGNRFSLRPVSYYRPITGQAEECNFICNVICVVAVRVQHPHTAAKHANAL